MKKISLFIITLFLFSSCSLETKNSEDLGGIAKNSFKTEEYKEKEQRCISYKEEIQKDIKFRNDLDPKDTHLFYIRTLKEMFYSLSLDTCVYVEKLALLDGVPVKVDYIVLDYYKNEEIKIFIIKEQRLNTGKVGDYEKYIEELKKGVIN